MTPRTIEIDGTTIHGIPSLYAELNRVFMPDEEWTLGESLDALDDLLYAPSSPGRRFTPRPPLSAPSLRSSRGQGRRTSSWW